MYEDTASLPNTMRAVSCGVVYHGRQSGGRRGVFCHRYSVVGFLPALRRGVTLSDADRPVQRCSASHLAEVVLQETRHLYRPAAQKCASFFPAPPSVVTMLFPSPTLSMVVPRAASYALPFGEPCDLRILFCVAMSTDMNVTQTQGSTVNSSSGRPALR